MVDLPLPNFAPFRTFDTYLTIAIPFCSKPEKDEIRRVGLGQVSFVETRKNMKLYDKGLTL